MRSTYSRRILIVIAVFIAACFISERGDREDERNILNSIDTVRFVFATNGRSYLFDDFQEGFNYELIKRYTKSIDKIFSVELDVVDSAIVHFLDGRYDVAIIDNSRELTEDESSSLIGIVPVTGKYSWFVSRELHPLVVSVNQWLSLFKAEPEYSELVRNYFKSYEISSYLENGNKRDALSPYDNIIKKFSSTANIDWRLIEAIIYQESRFHLLASSHKGAHGLMQLTSATAAKFGVVDLIDPEENIRGGISYLRFLFDRFSLDELDEDNILKFSLAAYNAGERRIRDLIKAAEANDLDSTQWDEVKQAFQYITGANRVQTTQYVDNIIKRYELYKQITEYEE